MENAKSVETEKVADDTTLEDTELNAQAISYVPVYNEHGDFVGYMPKRTYSEQHKVERPEE